MKILFVLADFNFPPKDGMQTQILNLLGYLNKKGHTCRVLAFYQEGESADLTGLQKALQGIQVVGLFPRKYNYAIQTASTIIRKTLRRYGIEIGARDLFDGVLRDALKNDNYDIVHLEGIAMVPYLESVGRKPSVLSCIDASSLRQRRLATESKGLWEKIYRLALHRASLLLERSTLLEATKVHVVSPVDAHYLSRSVPGLDVAIIGISLPDELFAYAPSRSLDEVDKSHRLLFLGDLRVGYINRGLAWFLSHVYPKVQSSYPGVRLRIVGRGNPTPDVAVLLARTPSAELVSWVEDYYEEILRSQVVVLPDPTGTGLKNRALQAMALGRPVVGTPTVFEGIPLANEEQAFICATAEGFAEATVALLGSEELRLRIGGNARALVLKWYKIDSVGMQWIQLYERALAQFG
jgi:glycosyltransferase involved in cell wall biosynthesis